MWVNFQFLFCCIILNIVLSFHFFIDYRFDIILDTLGNTTWSFNRGLMASGTGAQYSTIVNQMMYNLDTYGVIAGGIKSVFSVTGQYVMVSTVL